MKKITVNGVYAKITSLVKKELHKIKEEVLDSDIPEESKQLVEDLLGMSIMQLYKKYSENPDELILGRDLGIDSTRFEILIRVMHFVNKGKIYGRINIEKFIPLIEGYGLSEEEVDLALIPIIKHYFKENAEELVRLSLPGLTVIKEKGSEELKHASLVSFTNQGTCNANLDYFTTYHALIKIGVPYEYRVPLMDMLNETNCRTYEKKPYQNAINSIMYGMIKDFHDLMDLKPDQEVDDLRDTIASAGVFLPRELPELILSLREFCKQENDNWSFNKLNKPKFLAFIAAFRNQYHEFLCAVNNPTGIDQELLSDLMNIYPTEHGLELNIRAIISNIHRRKGYYMDAYGISPHILKYFKYNGNLDDFKDESDLRDAIEFIKEIELGQEEQKGMIAFIEASYSPPQKAPQKVVKAVTSPQVSSIPLVLNRNFDLVAVEEYVSRYYDSVEGFKRTLEDPAYFKQCVEFLGLDFKKINQEYREYLNEVKTNLNSQPEKSEEDPLDKYFKKEEDKADYKLAITLISQINNPEYRNEYAQLYELNEFMVDFEAAMKLTQEDESFLQEFEGYIERLRTLLTPFKKEALGEELEIKFLPEVELHLKDNKIVGRHKEIGSLFSKLKQEGGLFLNQVPKNPEYYYHSNGIYGIYYTILENGTALVVGITAFIKDIFNDFDKVHTKIRQTIPVVKNILTKEPTTLDENEKGYLAFLTTQNDVINGMLQPYLAKQTTLENK